jgi:hypothetical protein
VVDGLSDFSLSGPAAKSRRLVSWWAFSWRKKRIPLRVGGYCLLKLNCFSGALAYPFALIVCRLLCLRVHISNWWWTPS